MRSISRLIWVTVLITGCLAWSSIYSQDADSALTEADTSSGADTDKWDVAVQHVPADTLEFDVSEGTWISVDVSPDGSRIVFDLLGDIYEMPIGGGEAKLLSGGLPYEIQPRFSPDGKRILFTSDRGGGDNLWVMDADGTNRREVTKETFRLLNNGTWHPDGQYVVGRKHFTSGRSLGAGEMWMYRVDEGGSGVKLTSRKNQQQDAGEPVFSPDGNCLYWSEDMSGGDYFEYNKDANSTIYMIRRLDMKTGEIRNLISLNGGAARPQPSPDGKTIAFIRRVRSKSVLCLYNLETSEVTHLWDELDRDQQETWAIFGVWPGFDWTPDGKAVIIWAKGKIWKVDVATGDAAEIPFTAHVSQSVAKALRFSPDISSDMFDVNVIRWPHVTADGKQIIFQGMGYLWGHDLASGRKRRLTDQTSDYEFAPALSPDGRQIVYVTWNDRSGGKVKAVNTRGGTGRTLVDEPGHYVSAELSPDGSMLVYRKGSGDTFRGRLWDENPGIYLLNLDGKSEPKLLTRSGSSPRFSADGQRIYMVGRDGGNAALVSLNLLGSDRRVLATSEYASDFRLSPDEKWLAFEELWHSYVVPFPPDPNSININPGMKDLPVRKLSQDGGTYLSWGADSRTVYWSLGPNLFSIKLDSLYAEKPADKDPEADKEKDVKPKPDTTNLGWQEPREKVESDYYLVGGTILPMNDMSRIDNGVLHVKGNRIEAVGVRSDVAIPEGAKIFDISGMTVMPGFVDIHSHVWSSGNSIYSQQHWGLLANLAFGVTTIHDPSNNSEMIFANAEMVSAGKLIGPRIFSTGTILYGADGDFKTVIDKYADAVSAVRRTIAWGAFSVKSYNQPRRNQRQMVIKAAYDHNIMVVPEGGSTLHHNITQLLDGHTTLEHNIPVAPLYEPELKLLGRFGTGYTPTLVVCYGGLSGEKYWYQHTNVWENKRLSNFVPRAVIDPNAIRRTMTIDSEYHHIGVAQTAAEVVRRGGSVQIGSHGQMQGLAAHWELWMFAQGGMSNHEALRAASWMGARSIGIDNQLGSIQPGLLADLIVIEGDVLNDIRQSENIKYTVINGKLYDAARMDQLAPEQLPLPDGPFIDEVTRSEIGSGCIQQ